MTRTYYAPSSSSGPKNVVPSVLPRVFEHGVPLRSPPADPPPGNLEYLPVQEQYDQQRHVERGARGEYLVPEVLADHALLFVDALQVFRVLPAELRGQRHDECHAPHDDDHAHDPLAVPRVDVVHVSHGPVPAERPETVFRRGVRCEV